MRFDYKSQKSKEISREFYKRRKRDKKNGLQTKLQTDICKDKFREAEIVKSESVAK